MLTRRFVLGALFAVALAGVFTTVSAQDNERFYVTGFVRTPGSFVLEPNMTVQQGIALAGGLTERGSARGIKILRKVDGETISIDASLSEAVQPNDTILVRQRLQ